MNPQPGRFVTIEGVEGVGKSTNMAFIGRFLERRGITVLRTREPGGTPLAEGIRSLLLDRREEAVDAVSELLLMFAARRQHVEQVIKPALAAGQWVLCDRFTDSSYAYQGGGRGVPEARISQLEQLVLGDFEPDLTLLLDLPVAEGLARAEKRSEKDRFEQEELDFFQRVRDAFRARAAKFPSRFRVIAAHLDLEEVQSEISNVLEEFVLTN